MQPAWDSYSLPLVTITYRDKGVSWRLMMTQEYSSRNTKRRRLQNHHWTVTDRLDSRLVPALGTLSPPERYGGGDD